MLLLMELVNIWLGYCLKPVILLVTSMFVVLYQASERQLADRPAQDTFHDLLMNEIRNRYPLRKVKLFFFLGWDGLRICWSRRNIQTRSIDVA